MNEDEWEIDIPEDEELRGHIATALSFIVQFYRNDEQIPGQKAKIETVINKSELADLFFKMAQALPSEVIHLSLEEVYIMYASYDIMNKLMLENLGEEILITFVEELIDVNNPPLDKLKDFRDLLIFRNADAIMEMNEQLNDEVPFQALKEKLQLIEF